MKRSITGVISKTYQHYGHHDCCECPESVFVESQDGELWKLDDLLQQGETVTIVPHNGETRHEGITLTEKNDCPHIYEKPRLCLSIPHSVFIAMFSRGDRTELQMMETSLSDVFVAGYEIDAGDLSYLERRPRCKT